MVFPLGSILQYSFLAGAAMLQIVSSLSSGFEHDKNRIHSEKSSELGLVMRLIWLGIYFLGA